jgi:hypothetical protein
MPDYWPPPEEYERDRQRLERYRSWALPVAGGFGFALVAFIVWCLWRIATPL